MISMLLMVLQTLVFTTRTVTDCTKPENANVCAYFDQLITANDPKLSWWSIVWFNPDNSVRYPGGTLSVSIGLTAHIVPPPVPPQAPPDLVGQRIVGSDGTPDWHISVSGLPSVPTGYKITNAASGGIWEFPLDTGPDQHWMVLGQFDGMGNGDLYFDSFMAPTLPFHVVLTYMDGSTQEADTQ